MGKLFAKHIKLEEAKQFLQRARYDLCSAVGALPQITNMKCRMGIGAGTPARISDLIESGKSLATFDETHVLI